MNTPALVPTLRTLAILCTVSADGPIVIAKVYPSRPVTIGMPFAAGGSDDTIARILAERISTSWPPRNCRKHNRGWGRHWHRPVARATPDGYTLILGNWATHVVNGAALVLQYDVLKDFEPVS